MTRTTANQLLDKRRESADMHSFAITQALEATGDINETQPIPHTEHGFRHWDRTCPACNPVAERVAE